MAKRWYIVHAYSNFENKVAELIREQAKQRGLADLFEEVMVPKEKVVEVRRGRKVDAERKFFPGYVLVKMELTDEAFHLIKNTPKVTGFLGADNKPMPISDAEAARILHQVQEGIERPKPSVSFEVGEQVRVSDGPFASFNGTVEEVDESALAPQGRGVDLRPRHPGGARVRPGREDLTFAPADLIPRSRRSRRLEGWPYTLRPEAVLRDAHKSALLGTRLCSIAGGLISPLSAPTSPLSRGCAKARGPTKGVAIRVRWCM